MEALQELKATLNELNTAFEEYKKVHKDLIKKGVQDALAEAKFDKIGQTLDDLTGKKEDLEKRIKAEADAREALERKMNELGLSGKDGEKAAALVLETKSFNEMRQSFSTSIVQPFSNEEFEAYKSAVDQLLRKGKLSNPSDLQIKALNAGTDAEGGFLLPPASVGRVVSKVYELSPIRQIASVQQISGDRLEGLLDNDEASYGWVSEQGSRAETDHPDLGKYAIEAFEMYANPKASQRILDDSAIDIEAWLNGKVSNKFARVEGAAFCVGTGVGQPQGIASYTTAATADSSRAWGQLEHVVTGANGNFHTTTADPLFDLISAFKPGYLNRANWVTTREVIGKVRKFKGTASGDYVWQPGLQAGQPQMILGYPVVFCQDMPALGTGSLSMALGDFGEGYQIVDRLGIRVLRDPYTAKPYVHFYSTKRVGGGVVNFEAIKFIKFST